MIYFSVPFFPVADVVIGTGKMIVEFFSVAISVASGETRAASRSVLLQYGCRISKLLRRLNSPSAWMTFALLRSALPV
jgi:hypothetical protein